MTAFLTKRSRITSKHQVTIPQAFFECFDGAEEVEFVMIDGHVCIRPVRNREDDIYNASASGRVTLAEPVWTLPADLDADRDETEKLFMEDWK